MQDIADELHISKNAVSLALSGKAGTSDALREKVVEAATRMGYLEAALAEKRILFIVDEYIQFQDVFYYPIFSEVMRYAQGQGYHVVIAGVSRKMQDEMTIPDIVYEFPVSGVLSMGLLAAPYLQKIMDMDLPLVMLVNQVMGLRTDFVMSDNTEGAFQAVNYLMSMGHRKIGFLSHIYSYRSFYQRWQGYQLALRSAGLPVVPEYSIVSEIHYGSTPHPGDYRPVTEEQIRRYVDTMLGLADPPTAWMCGHDPMALAIMNELQRRGISIPDDLSIVGFDNIEHAALVHPALTTMDAKRAVMSRCAVDLLRKHAVDPAAWNPVNISVICELVPGGTVKKLP